MLSDPHFCIRFHHKAVVSGGRVWTKWLLKLHKLITGYIEPEQLFNILLRLNFI